MFALPHVARPSLTGLAAVVTSMNIVVIIYVLCAGFPFGTASNLVPFAPFGVRGIFTASSIVFFSFVGFDAAATAAEEVPPLFPMTLSLHAKHCDCSSRGHAGLCLCEWGNPCCQSPRSF